MKNADRAIQNARLVLQYAQLKAGDQTRDESMAENVKWVADQNPQAKIVMWAHNGHIAYGGYSGRSTMGGFLRKTFGHQLINFGFAFNEGSFQAMEQGKGFHPFAVGPAPEDSLDWTLAETNIPIFALDFRELPKEGGVTRWFSQPRAPRSIGAMYSESLATRLWSNTPAPQQYDVLLFIKKTTAAHPNPQSF